MSGTVPIHDELRAALAAPTPQQDQELVNLGVPKEVVWFVGAAKIQPSDGLYEPAPSGIPAWIIPCFHDYEVCDLLAFTSDAPGRCWLRLGVASCLGADALGDAVMDEPVRVLKTPMSWLRSGAPSDAVVMVDHDAARRDLAGHSITAEDIEHGLELDLLLTIPAERPRISVPA